MIITCESVSYSYRGRRRALNDFTARLGPGVVGLLGPNGAGKSTLMALIATTRSPQSGRISVGKHDVSDAASIRRQLGFLPQGFAVMPLETVRRTVEYAAWARGIDRSESAEAAERAMEQAGISDRAGERVRTLSGGYRQRLGLACALAGNPAFVLLDEPTAGIDPVQRTMYRKLVAELGETRTVVLSTHMLEDVAVLGSQVVVMYEGRCAFTGNAEELASIGADDTSRHRSALEAGYEISLRRDALG